MPRAIGSVLGMSDHVRWEYKTVALAAHGWTGGKVDQPKLEQMLDELGSQGWELVSVFDTNSYQGATRDVLAVLKRSRSAGARG